jgi:chromosome condensin MukBEF ATPase and DNA-binding subunit MukB
MEQLDPKQKEHVSKMSTVRLIAKLIQIGHTEDELADLQRGDLQTLYAKAILSGSDKPEAKAALTPSGVESKLERDRLTFEITKFQQQQAERERELTLEREKLAQQQAERDAQITEYITCIAQNGR